MYGVNVLLISWTEIETEIDLNKETVVLETNLETVYWADIRQVQDLMRWSLRHCLPVTGEWVTCVRKWANEGTEKHVME